MDSHLTSCDSVNFSDLAVFKVISNLNWKSAQGPDRLPPFLFKSLVQVLCTPISLLFSLIFQTGSIPDMWKTAIVTPIFKKGPSSHPGNYRPISLTCSLGKIYEAVVKTELLAHFKTNNLVTRHQHGFLEGHSTTTNMLETVLDWSNCVDNKGVVKVLYVDFANAFLTVSIPKLLYKLKNVGVGGNLLSTIESFLTGRTQRVRVGSCVSADLDLISGVPQGSILGPFLFLIYINDLPSCLNVNFRAKLFADDLKSYNLTDYRIAPDDTQSVLDAVLDWSHTWQMNLATHKCGSLLLKGNIHYDDTNELHIGDDSLAVLNVAKDLGILIDRDLKFSSHIDAIIGKAKQRIYLILKSFHIRDIKPLTFAYTAYILPILDYGSSVWSPSGLARISTGWRAFSATLRSVCAVSLMSHTGKG
jgi:hypothetical protein